MIRRQAGQEYWLIAQHDHAQISGRLAEQIGNGPFSTPLSAAAVMGIALHDSGWPLHDDQPTLNALHIPVDVFETPRHLGLRVWEASTDRAVESDDYAGLLVSLHNLALSVFATEQAPINNTKWDLSDTRARFEVNRFQHRMIELQESLRRRLGLRTDRPLTHGLAVDSPDPKEQRLTADFRWLQAMDRLSLAICCTHSPFAAMEPVYLQPGKPAIAISIARPQDDFLTLGPWPFGENEIRIDMPFRRLPARTWPDDETFRRDFAAAPIERFTVTVRPHTI